jgi:hypothetical protein
MCGSPHLKFGVSGNSGFSPDTPPMNRTRRHTIRFTPAEWDLINDRAHSCGLSFGTYLRQVGLGSIPRERRNVAQRQVRFQLLRVGNNLNQIARHLNSGMPLPESEIRQCLTRLDALLEDI